jgi:hypothetical protein
MSGDKRNIRRFVAEQARDYWRLATRNLFAWLALTVAAAAIVLLVLIAAGEAPLPHGSPFLGLWRVMQSMGVLLHGGVGELARLEWPGVALLLGALALFAPRIRSSAAWLARRASRVKVGEVELEFTPEAAKELGQNTDEAFKLFRERADREFRRQIAALDIRPLLEATLRHSSAHTSGGALIPDVQESRCTLYVKDILFEDRLYQLIEYYPWDGKLSAGRTFSTRFGIVGRAWRTEKHMGEGNAQTDHDALMRDWGMTREEASRLTRQRRSYICAILKAPAEGGSEFTDGLPLGLFFADSPVENAFGSASEATKLGEGVAHAALETGLRTKLKVLRDELNRYSAGIRA